MQTCSTRPTRSVSATSFVLLTFAVALSLAACASTPSAPDAPEQMPPLAPLPFTAGEIRDAMPVGTELRLRMEAHGEVTIETWVVTAADGDGCTITSKVFDEAGALLEDQGAGTSTWNDLRDHARFPDATTERSESHVDVPAGSFATWLYVVRGPGDDGKETTSRYHFAKSLPGPPVSMTVEVEGQVVARMTLVERK